MGSFAKAWSQLGNIAAARLAAPATSNSSRGILQASVENKTGLSRMLDSTLREGHDMKTFGLGTAASLASVERYARFTAAMYHVYTAMESSLDAAKSPAVAPFWSSFGGDLRRSDALALDLADVAASSSSHPPTPATRDYMRAIEAAGAKDEEDGGGRLIGHAYCRYFADLMGGQFLAAPTRYALSPAVGEGTPRHYDFGAFGAERKASVERLYASFNEAGDALASEAARRAVVEEVLLAYRHNVAVYTEEGAVWSGALRGAANLAGGVARAKLQMPRAAAPSEAAAS